MHNKQTARGISGHIGNKMTESQKDQLIKELIECAELGLGAIEATIFNTRNRISRRNYQKIADHIKQILEKSKEPPC